MQANRVEAEFEILTDSQLVTGNKPQSIPLKILVMIFVCSLNICSSYCLDLTAALQDVIMLNMEVTFIEYGVLNSVYSLPNIFFVLVAGFLVDYILGIRKAACLFTGILIIGQSCFTLGAFFKQFPLMVIGRFMLGLGAKATFICSNKYLSLWFSSSLLTFACSLQFTFMKSAQSVSLMYSHQFYGVLLTQFPQMLRTSLLALSLTPGILAAMVSFLASVIVGLIDYKNREDTFFVSDLKSGIRRIPGYPKAYWLNCTCCTLFYSAFYCFNSFAVNFLGKKYDMKPVNASYILSVGMGACILAAPVAGTFSYYIGRELTSLNLSALLYTLCQVLLAYTRVNPTSIKIIGDVFTVCFSILVWTIIPRVISKNDIGMAIAIMSCIQSTGLGITPLLGGRIIENQGFFSFQILIIILTAMALLFSSVMYYFDRIECSGKLNKSAKARSLLTDR